LFIDAGPQEKVVPLGSLTSMLRWSAQTGISTYDLGVVATRLSRFFALPLSPTKPKL
jgi:hypothetical protein